MDKNVDVNPTSEPNDILLRWIGFVNDRSNHDDDSKFGTKNSVGKVFGNNATLTSIYCLGNGYCDLSVVIKDADPEVGQVRVKIFHRAMHNIQVYIGYGFVDGVVDIDMDKRPSVFQTYHVEKMIDYLQQVIV